MIARWSILQVLGAALLWIAYAEGWLTYLIAGDRTYMTAAIGALLICGLVASILRQWTWADFIRDHLPTLGLLGTFIGFGMALGGVEGAEYELRDLGVATALNTTVCGLIGYLWLGVTRMVCRS